MGLSEALTSPTKKAAVVADCCSLVDEEVRDKGGLSGLAVKAGYAAIKGVKPGFVAEVVDKLLPEFAANLDPIWQEGKAKGDAAAYLTSNKSRAADALLQHHRRQIEERQELRGARHLREAPRLGEEERGRCHSAPRQVAPQAR